jgi:hypothetical protein
MEFQIPYKKLDFYTSSTEILKYWKHGIPETKIPENEKPESEKPKTLRKTKKYIS